MAKETSDFTPKRFPEKSELLEMIFNTTLVAIVVTQNRVVKYINPEFTIFFGYTEEEALGRTVDELIIPDKLKTKTETKKVNEELKKGMRMESETIRRTKDGRTIEVLSRLSPIIVDNEVVGGFSFYTDISERKQAQRELGKAHEELESRIETRTLALQKIEKKFRNLFEQSIDAIIIHKDGVIIDVNKSMCQLLGFRREQLIDMHVLKLHVESDTQSVLEKVERGEDFVQYETRWIKADGSIIDVEMSSNQIDMDERIYQVIARDISERKEAEKKIKISIEAAVQANTAKSEFLANMSHEIRTPLNGVMGVLNLLLSTNPDNEQLDLIETGKRSADNLLTVINDVLDFSKIEAGELDLEILNFNLRTSIAEIVELPAIQAQGKGLEIVYDIHQDIPSLLKGDPGRLRQILLNLTCNAIKFTEKGEIVISASLIAESDERAILKFEIRDTGIGIPEDKLEMVFESFKQTDASTTRTYGGTGLGLSISKKLAELMGGEIGVFSRPGEGSTFWFTAQFEKQIGSSEEKLAPPVDIRGKRFLVVDDNKTNQAVLKGYIEAWECFCDLADSGEMALSMMNAVAKVNAPFDAVLIDMQMPGMDGAELGKRIKGDPALKDTRIIMLTSQGMRGDASRMKRIGFAAYLTKPVRRSQLFDCLISALSKLSWKDSEARTRIVTKYTISEERREKIRILLAEDNIINQKLALRLIEKFGFKADCAANGKEAIKALESFKYDIVLMDIQMPEMDGFEATRIIRDPGSSVLDHNVKIIAMTAHAMQGDRERCINAGMNDYTNKPIDPQELLDTIERQIKMMPS